MDSKKIYALLAAIDCGSLTAAAEKLGYTQSGLTHMMNSLENELGLNLLVRSKSGVHLSPAGQELLPAMRAFSEAADGLEQAADKLRQHSFTTLRLGAYTSVTRQWLPAILAAYRDICPDTEVSISMGDSVGTYEAVRNDELDCAVVSYQPHLCQGLSWTHLRDDELVAILPADCGDRCICRIILECCVRTDLFLIRSCQPRLHANALVPVRAFARFCLCLQTASGRPQKDDSQRCSPQPVLPPFLTFSAPAHKSMILSIPSYPQTVTIAEPPLIFRAFGAPKIGSSNVTIILHD